ncbi:cytochrome P450 [Gymnopilus junonius]|uniref:Cytochrome P450 n=1 Tax=Gymnopilus junonius TaxID=109634 RepID=A0A9P5TUB0_GYMJU|nr:cytochrome P450 [Gymnopilus junonius]
MFLSVAYKLFLVFLGFSLAIVTHYALHSIVTRRAFRHLPRPPISSFLWGEEWELYHRIPGSLYTDWHRRFGGLVAFTGAFGHQILSVTDPRAIGFILGDGAYQFPKPQGVRAWFKATLGEGILWVEGRREHEHQRRLLAPTLNQQSVRQLVDIFFETSIYMANQWSRIIEENSGHESEIEITDWAGRFALDTVGRAAFSYNFDCLSGEPHQLASALDGLTNNEHRRSSFYMRALFWLVPSILFIGKKGEMIRKVKIELGAIASKMWSDAKYAGDKDDRTLLANMLRLEMDSKVPMDEELVISQMRTVISAGYETVSAVLAWMLYELATHPELQAKLQQEVSSSPDHSFDDLNSGLPFLDAALKETLRLHPPISENHHEAAKLTILPLSDARPETGENYLVVPKGTTIVIPVNVMHLDENVWGKDSSIFRPERWLESERPNVLRGQELLAFSLGPRSCIGKTFAMIEIKSVMITLLRRFSFRCPKEIEPFQSFVIRPRVAGEIASSLPLLVSKR